MLPENEIIATPVANQILADHDELKPLESCLQIWNDDRLQEKMKGIRNLIPPISLAPTIISLKLFLEVVPSSSADNVGTRVTWMFSWRIKCVESHLRIGSNQILQILPAFPKQWVMRD